MTDSVKKWVVKWNKTSPKLVVGYDSLNRDYLYIIFTRQRDKAICLGRVKHGMLIRYGVETLVRYSNNSMPMWTSGNATPKHVMILTKYLSGTTNTRDFDFNEIKDVKE